MSEKTLEQMTDVEIFHSWRLWKDRLDHAKEAERALRDTLVARTFRTLKEGANKGQLILPEGPVILTVTQPFDRKVDEPVLSALILDVRKTGASHPLATVNFDKLIRLKPELAVGEYRTLTPEQSIIFDVCLVVKPGSPQLAFKQAKTQ